MDNKSLTLRTYLEIPYDKLEEMNLKAMARADREDADDLEKEYRAYLKKETRLKAVTLCFSDIEGRFHMLDYDKKFLLESADNLTFDGSSIKGFSSLSESDLRLQVDWPTIRWLPSDIFGPGKVIMFADVLNRDKSPYVSDMRLALKTYAHKLKIKDGLEAYVSAEVEGFLVDGVNAEQNYTQDRGFDLISSGGYFHSLPLDRLRQFMDRAAEAQRAMGFENEKDHPEVAPSQFEMNYKYGPIVRAGDNVQLYKLVCRQVAQTLGMTATFLPKPKSHINGSGMHINFSFNRKGKNIFYEKKGKENLSALAWDAISRLLNHAPEICLTLNASVNAYRRLDPNFEAPNQIKVSPVDRGSMIRIPAGNEKSARIEVRSVGPDVNPYLAFYTIFRTTLEGKKMERQKNKRERLRFLPGTIHDAIKLFKSSDYIEKILGRENKEKYLYYKQRSADRCPRELGTRVKTDEVIYHHDVTNQMLWNRF